MIIQNNFNRKNVDSNGYNKIGKGSNNSDKRFENKNLNKNGADLWGNRDDSSDNTIEGSRWGFFTNQNRK